MAILATKRKWLVTSLCAATRSPCSRQRLASIYSSCGSSIGNRRISSRYRDKPDSAVMIGRVADWAIIAPSLCWAPGDRQAEAPRRSLSRVEPGTLSLRLFRKFAATANNHLTDDHTHLSRAKTSARTSLRRDADVTGRMSGQRAR